MPVRTFLPLLSSSFHLRPPLPQGSRCDQKTTDRLAAAQFFPDIFGLSCRGVEGGFAPVQVNDSLTLDF